jgi:hypothetical protein
MTARNRLTNDGMRRCQRLPELTHPVDFARPIVESSKAVPHEILEIRAVPAWPTSLVVDAPDLREGREHNLLKEACV